MDKELKTFGDAIMLVRWNYLDNKFLSCTNCFRALVTNYNSWFAVAGSRCSLAVRLSCRVWASSFLLLSSINTTEITTGLCPPKSWWTCSTCVPTPTPGAWTFCTVSQPTPKVGST